MSRERSLIANFLFRLFSLCDPEVAFIRTITRVISTREMCAVKFRKHARIDVLATHVHLILGIQSGYLNTYYVYMNTQVNYAIKEPSALLSFTNWITVK